LLTKLIQPGTTYFDVGANIGLTSLPILQVQPDCDVVSFEPSPNALPYLSRTVRESPYAGRWQVVGAMVDDTVGESEFYLAKPAEGAFDGSRPTGRVATAGMVTVPVTTLDHEWVTRGCPKVSVIKIDVEGGELGVLRGAKDCLRQTRPFIVLEWNEINLKSHAILLTDLLKFADTHQFSILRLPDLVPVQTGGHLRVCAALGSENFLLSPD